MRCARTQANTSEAAGSSVNEIIAVGRPSRTAAASRAITVRSAPTIGARSVLLITSRSEKGHAGTALARHLVAARNIDDEDLHVDQPGGEGSGEIVATRFDEDEVERLVGGDQILDRVEVRRDVVADGGVRTAAGLHRGDALVGQHRMAAQKVCVFCRVDVVGQDRDGDFVAQGAAQRGDQRGFTRPHRPADPDAQRLPRLTNASRTVDVLVGLAVYQVRWHNDPIW